MKQKRYWLRGGFGATFIVFFLDLYLLTDGRCIGLSQDGTSCHIGITEAVFLNIKIVPVFYWPMSFVCAFLIGSLAGWIYGKIKNKKLVPRA